MKTVSLLSSFLLAAAGATVLHAELVQTYVGIDSNPKVTFGTYVGKPNPNLGRLTFFHGHAFPENPPNNHYHGIGAYTYTGPFDTATVTNSNAGNRIPEVYTALPPLTLVPTTNAAYAGHLVSAATAEHYSGLRMRSVQDLARYGFGAGEWYLFNSSGKTRTNTLDGAVIALELIAKTPGLKLGAGNTPSLVANPGDRLTLGDGDTLDFLPVFSVAVTAAPGRYTASFKLVDTSSTAGHVTLPESGIFHLDFQVPAAPVIGIQQTVTLTVPLVTAGHVFESAPKVDGPWTIVANAPQAEFVGEGESRTATGKAVLTVPVGNGALYYRYRKE